MHDGLSQPSVMSIYQDTLGRMWLGTREGVNIYDGKIIRSLKPQEISQHNNEHFISSNEVKNIVGGSNGDVFLLVGNVLYRYDIVRDLFKKIHDNGVVALGNTLHRDILYAVKDSLFLYKIRQEKKHFLIRLNIRKIASLHQTNDSILFIGAEKGLYRLNLKTLRKEQLIKDVDVSNIYLSSRNELWIATRMNGLYSIKRDGKIVKAPSSPKHVVSKQIRQIVEDDKQNIWFGTFDGLQKYNPYKDTYEVYRAENHSGSLSHSSVFSLYRDRQGTIWVGSYYGGVNYFYQQRYIYRHYSCDVKSDDCLNFPIVGNMIEDKDRNLWIATDGGGDNFLNRKTKKFTYYKAGKNGLLHNNIKTISYDRKRDQIYVGTHTGGLSRLDRKTGHIHNFLLEPNYVGPNDVIFHTEFYNDVLYVSARNGFWKYNPATNKFQLLKKGRYYVNFKIDDRGYVWLNSKFDITIMNLEDIHDSRLFDFGDPMLADAHITNLNLSSDSKMYICTSGYGFYSYDFETGLLRHFTREEDNLLSNYCYNIIETSNNNIIITTDKGLSIYSPFTSDIYSVEVYRNEGISAITNGCGIFVASDELIFVGGIDGMISFYEKDILYNNNTTVGANFYFSDLQVNNTEVVPGDKTKILKESLPFTDKVCLSPTQNNIIIGFSNSNYVGFLRNTWYQYKLEGFDNKWISTTQTSLHYTNLPSGNYVLRVREKGNLVNMFEGKEITLPIIVLTPWYKTGIAYLMYFVVLAGIVYAIWRFNMSKKLFAISLENEKKEKKRIEELNKLKLRFFTNISHEFRTPLTLISGQLEMLVQDRDLTLSVKRKVNRIYKNTIHMRNLITELLDFRKQDQGFLKLRVEKHHIVAFMENIYLTFKDYAVKRNIKYEFECTTDKDLELWFDAVQLQKAIFNLLSNSFKYTLDKGRIVVRLKKEEDCVLIEVEDTGKGISEIDLKNIFDRFYQVGDENSALTTGTGIGLALTKGIVELHKGTISVKSEVGKGSIFCIRLLMGNSHFTEEQLSNTESQVDLRSSLDDKIYEIQLETADDDSGVLKDTNQEPIDDNTEENGKPYMLIVDDDNDIINMLEEVFAPIYKIAKAYDGQQGLDLAFDLQPDIIVSDVMMPRMSGKEMCSKIKNSVEISHIPVVLLTAQSAEEQALEGFVLGADDYITKPFNISLLVARCNNLVNNRRSLMSKLKDSAGAQQMLVNTTSMAINAVDQKFIDKVTHIIKDNFDNSDFNMDMLAAELNMGRTKLYSRFKEITNLTPNEFTLRMKLEEGKKLLINSPELNISEISYKLGFSSLRYFSKCFKTFCGVTPQVYRKNAVNGTESC